MRRTAPFAMTVLLVLAGCSVQDEPITDWCKIRTIRTGPSWGMYSGGSSTHCRVKLLGWWFKLDEPNVGGATVLAPDLVLLNVPGERKLLRRWSRTAVAPCPGEVLTLPPGHGALDCVGFLAGPAPGVPLALRLRRLDFDARVLSEWTLDVRPRAPARSLAITGAAPPPPSPADAPSSAPAGATSSGPPAGAAGIAGREAERRVFANPAVNFYDRAGRAYFLTYDDANLSDPACALLRVAEPRPEFLQAPPGTTGGACSEPGTWRAVAPALFLPE